MKLRIRGNSLRLRLTRPEVDAFGRTGRVSDRIVLAPGRPFSYTLRRAADCAAIEARLLESGVEVRVPAAAAARWTGSDDVSLSVQQNNGEDGGLGILIEKDFACLVDREGEDDRDAYPNPRAEAS